MIQEYARLKYRRCSSALFLHVLYSKYIYVAGMNTARVLKMHHKIMLALPQCIYSLRTIDSIHSLRSETERIYDSMIRLIFNHSFIPASIIEKCLCSLMCTKYVTVVANDKHCCLDLSAIDYGGEDTITVLLTSIPPKLYLSPAKTHRSWKVIFSAA